MKIPLVLLAVVVSCSLPLQIFLASNDPRPSPQSEALVPDKETAVRVAEAILFRIYGEKNIRRQQPYRIKLHDGKWIIDGAPPPAGMTGGSFHIVILQSDGRVIEVTHGV